VYPSDGRAGPSGEYPENKNEHKKTYQENTVYQFLVPRGSRYPGIADSRCKIKTAKRLCRL